MLINCKVLLILCSLSYGDAQRLRKGGQNVCTKYRPTYIRERYCGYSTWQACCYWLYKTTTIYQEESYCCSGYRQSGSSCLTPICSTNCGGPTRGTCIGPEKCRCRRGYFGDTCEGETCSSVKPCYPGVCRTNNRGAYCECKDGFALTSIREGCTTLSRTPEITHAFATLSFYHTMKQMDIYNLSVDASVTSSSNNNYIWTNMKKFNTLTADMSAMLNLPTLPGKPTYLSKNGTKIGISSARVTIRHSKARRKRGLRKRSSSLTVFNCVNRKTNRQISDADPESSLLNCRQMKASNFTQRVDSGDDITLTFTAISGGQESILGGQKYNFKGQSAEVKVHFKVDHDSPTPPSNNRDIFHVAEEITKGPSIRTSWQGWKDTLSRMYRYNWEIFRLEKTGNELREQGQKYLSPIHSFVMNHTGSRTYSYDYTPSQPGVYSMILEASDRANNSLYVRRFVIFDPKSEITTTSTPLKALSGNANADYKWQTWTPGNTNNITFSWKGHFINKLHKDGGFLGSINEYPPQLNDMNVPPGNIFKKKIDERLTDPSSKRHQTAIPNVNGITSFEVAKTTKGGIPTFIQKDLNQTHTFPGGSITDGTFVELWTKARDIMGNTKISKLLLGFDRTPPVLHNTTIRRNIGVGFTYTSTLSFKAFDRHSGVKQIDFRIIEKATGTETKSGVIPAATSQIEPAGYLGYTLEDGSHYLYQHNFPLNNRWLTPRRDDAQSKSFELQLTVTNRAGLAVDRTMEIGDLNSFKGIGTSATTTTTPTLPQRSDISCNADSIDTFVPISMLPSGAPLTWRDPTCSVTSNGTHMLSSIGLSQCGTTVTITKDNVEFENELKAQSTNSTANSLIDFGEDAYVIPVKCIYPRTETPMTSYVPLQQHVRFYEKRYGHFDVDIMQYDSDKFSSAIQNLGTPRKVALNSEIYVEVKLNDQFNNGLGIHIDKCIATPTSSPSDSTLYTLLTDGCPASQHVHLYNSPANKVRFGVRAFQFTSQTGSMVYIHCQTSMCQAGTPYCTSNCVTAGRRKRDVAPDQKSHLVSAGPFVLVADEQGTPIRMSSIVASVSAFVAVVACIVAIVGWTRKTRTTSTKEQGLL